MATLSVGINPKPAEQGARLVRKSMADINRQAGNVERGTNRLGRTANDNFRRMARGIGTISAGFRNLIALAPALGGAIAAAFSIRPIFAFQDALAEVSTLVDTTTFDMRGLEQAALDQAAAFGGGAAAQAKAFYQIISAGASTAAEATEILTAANRLAVGGVTDIATAADGLTSVLNAYGDKVESAAAVSDAMFVAMRAGKTTIGELSSTLGRVAPLAAQTGVNFDELTAAVSALTKGGISTAEAVTGVRAILAAVAKPTSEAQKLSAKLGLEFNAAGLAAKGFEGFLADLAAKTGGSTELLAELFGGVEALVPIMALSGQAGEDFAAILEQMGVKAGSTQEAFDKMAQSPGFQAGRVWSALTTEIIKVGDAMGTILVPAMRALADHMDDIFKLAKVVGAALLVAFGPAILSAIAAGFVTIGTAAVGAINAITVAIAANPLGALLVAFTAIITAAYLFRDDIKTIFGVDLVQAAKDDANKVIGAFVGAYDVVVQAWSNLPTLFSALGKQAWNNLVGQLEKPWTIFGSKVQLIDASGLKAGLTDAEQAALGGASTTFNAAFNRDFIADKLGTGTSEGTSTENTVNTLKQLQEQLANTANAAKGLSTAADGAGKKLSDAAEKAKKKWQEMQEAIQGAKKSLGEGFGGILRGLIDGTMSWKDALISAGQALLKFLNQMAQAKTGTGLFGGGLFQGLIGGLLGIGFAKGGVFQNGNLTAFANGGVVNRPTVFPFASGVGLMGEAGAEAIMPLRRASNGDLGVAATRMHSPANDEPLRLELVSRFDADGGFDSAVERASRPIAIQESAKAAGKVAQAVPAMVDARTDEREVRRIRPQSIA